MLRFLALAATWLVLSGRYSLERPLIAAFGVLSCVAVWLVARRMDAISDTKSDGALGLRTFLYLPWLLWEIVKANFQVARIIVDPKLPISPRLVRVKASQRGDMAQVLYANSITLTPGTIALDVRNNTISVHALNDALADGLVSGEMDRRVARTERLP